MTSPLRPVERPFPLAVPTQRTDTSPCQPQLAHGVLGQPTHDPPGHTPVVPHQVPTLDSEASQPSDLNMLPWPGFSQPIPGVTPQLPPTPDLQTCQPRPTVPAEDPRARKSTGQACSASPSRRPLSPLQG
ncbi:hypothetical protein ACRRTK_014680 [Alexandromys fortis]